MLISVIMIIIGLLGIYNFNQCLKYKLFHSYILFNIFNIIIFADMFISIIFHFNKNHIYNVIDITIFIFYIFSILYHQILFFQDETAQIKNENYPFYIASLIFVIIGIIIEILSLFALVAKYFMNPPNVTFIFIK
jgi:hypothetical protein